MYASSPQPAATWLSTKTGKEFHVDFMVNQFLEKNFALGAQGYWYNQVTGVSGDGKLSLVGKWLFDSHHENRMKGNYGQLVLCKKF